MRTPDGADGACELAPRSPTEASESTGFGLDANETPGSSVAGPQLMRPANRPLRTSFRAKTVSMPAPGPFLALRGLQIATSLAGGFR